MVCLNQPVCSSVNAVRVSCVRKPLFQPLVTAVSPVYPLSALLSCSPPLPFLPPGAQLPREPTKDGVISGLVSKGVSLNDLTRGKCDIAITNPDMSSVTRQLLISVHAAISAVSRHGHGGSGGALNHLGCVCVSRPVASRFNSTSSVCSLF